MPDEKAAADITRAVAFAQLDTVFAGADNAVLAGDGWRIIQQHTSAITPSPLFRTVLLRPLPQNKVMQTLRPWRTHLQTCGLVVADRDRIPSANCCWQPASIELPLSVKCMTAITANRMTAFTP